MHNLLKKLRIAYYIVLYGIARHRLKAIVAFVGVCFIIFSLFQLPTIVRAFQQEVFIEGMVGQYQKDTLPPVIENLISLGLTKIAPDGTAIPSAATRWDITEEGRLYTFYLREDLYWHDGTPFTAADLSYLFQGIETNPVSAHIIQFRLKNPYAPFPTLLAKPLLKGENLAGLGEYRVKRVDASANRISAIELERTNKQATQDENAKIIFRFYPSASDLITAYKLGELKAALGFFNPQELLSWRTVAYQKQVLYDSYVAVLFNTRQQTGNMLSEKNIRQALSYAIPRGSVLGEEAVSPIPPTSWAFNPGVKQYVYDLNVAKDLLQRKDASFSGEIVLTATAPYKQQAESIVESWKKLGLIASVSVVPEIGKNFQAALVRQQIPPDPDQYALWHSLQKETNLTGYSTPRIDKLLEDGRAIMNQEERKIKYEDFQKFLVEDAPAVFLYYPYESLLLHTRYNTAYFRKLNGFDQAKQEK